MSTASQIRERDTRRCQRCACLGGNWHHRKRRSQGGTDAASNGILLCGSGTTGCHGYVHANPEEAMARGWLVSRDADPAAVPVWSMTWQSWVLLADDLTVRLIDTPPGQDARLYRPEPVEDGEQCINCLRYSYDPHADVCYTCGARMFAKTGDDS